MAVICPFLQFNNRQAGLFAEGRKQVGCGLLKDQAHQAFSNQMVAFLSQMNAVGSKNTFIQVIGIMGKICIEEDLPEVTQLTVVLSGK
jgi:hypothetical protein